MENCDILIRGGTVIDGTGAPGYRGDVAITGDRIVCVGDCAGWQGAEVIDAAGRIVAPGFIDVHTHDDVAVLETPEMPFKITQGVTSIIAGNCGISAAPLAAEGELPPPFTLMFSAKKSRFADVDAYRAELARAAPAVNVGLLVGHSTLRVGAMGLDLDRGATAAEIEQMGTALERALAQGAIGLSTGLEYPPSKAAAIDEIVPLARRMTAFPHTVYTSHMRDEGDGVLESVRETLETGRQSGARVVISHHKCAGEANFGRSVETLALIAKAQESQEVGLDVYPYTAASTALLHSFAEKCTDVKVMWSRPHPEMSGRMLDDIAAGWGVTREEAIDRLHPAGAIYFCMDEGDLRRIISFPTSMIGSDGIPGSEKPHPRLWGTFPRVLGHYAREQGLLSMAQAVHKMTGLSSAQFGLSDRGRLAEEMKADVVVFDPDTVIDRASYDDPEQPAAGISHVLVNGVVTLENGMQTSRRAGAFLHH
ncbi:N-acyl-D-amino-acid deacylase family protein [Marimonas lutisalis]|uniref:N-acyl-D-amino-acid deacylase family protein n=1 Tax=Marimonas lutisalis TaxID=2545756 RepID=UPI0010F814F5|nr:D-aminoacylase [Marimonas lutisalis]